MTTDNKQPTGPSRQSADSPANAPQPLKPQAPRPASAPQPTSQQPSSTQPAATPPAAARPAAPAANPASRPASAPTPMAPPRPAPAPAANPAPLSPLPSAPASGPAPAARPISPPPRPTAPAAAAMGAPQTAPQMPQQMPQQPPRQMAPQPAMPPLTAAPQRPQAPSPPPALPRAPQPQQQSQPPQPAQHQPQLLPQAPSAPPRFTAEPLRAIPPQQPQPQPPRPEPVLERHYLPAGPPRPRASLDEKAKTPSIGGLIHSMQAKPSNAPYKAAAISSAVWFIIGSLLGWVMIGQTVNDFSNFTSVFASSSAFILLACIVVPIALFWFIAQLVWRAQEMKLMASAMTEVAIRLAEPDKLAEQRVASVGQTIRRQVSAMDDAISRALGRAGELEALVHNEVAALERSYTQNEFIIRNLLQELVNEREAIAHNSQQVKQTLQGVGAEVSQGIRQVTEGIGSALAQHGNASAAQLQQAGDAVTQAMRVTTQETVAIKQKIAAELPALLERMNVEQQKLGKVIEHATHNLGTLDSGIAQRTQELDERLGSRVTELDNVMSKHASEINKRLVQKVKALDASLSMRAKVMDKTLATRAAEIDRSFLSHRDVIDTTIQGKARELDESIARQARAMDASLNEKARVIDAALTQRMSEIDNRPPARGNERAEATQADLTMLRGAQALERAMALQSETLSRALEGNKARLERTIEHQNTLSPQIGALTDKHNKLIKEHAALAASVREQFARLGQDLFATARLLTGVDMKMSAMMGPQQNKARAVLADITARADEMERSRRSFAAALDNSLMIVEETANDLHRLLVANASPRAERAALELVRISEDSRMITSETKKEMQADQLALAQQVVDAVSSMSRSTSRTRMLPGEVATTSTDIQRSVHEQLRALDALAQLSNAALGANRVTANGLPTGTQAGGGRPGNGGMSSRPQMPPLPPVATAAAPAGASRQRSQWSFGDLLARVAETDVEAGEAPLPTYRPASSSTASRGSQLSLDTQDVLRMDDIARALDSHTAALAWSRYQSGERNVFTRRLYSAEGQRLFDHVAARFGTDGDFRATVDRYIADFERLMAEAEEKDPSGRVIQNYLVSESGRVYLVLAHASGRLG